MIHFNTAGAGVTETSVVDRMKALFDQRRMQQGIQWHVIKPGP
ncbi:hypothetical protein C8E00_1162 [Chromohalobacter marismortui]|uniref:Uncharacterized protein n=1 Tax=Chromohalobacter marismortui TaxID=42055 RepID=A0A4R7NCD1_9GAMM|nr:hypothetical protein C8E00_1162 [Chromohalobacter marismortui]